MKNFSPIVGFRVHQWFDHWAVSAIRANGSTERVNVCQSEFVAKERLLWRARARGMVVTADSMRAALPEEA